MPGIDVDALLEAADSTRRPRPRSRPTAPRPAPPPGSPTEFQGKSATTPDGEVRYTAPSLVFTGDDGRTLEAGGFQSTEAYDVLVANLDPTLRRRAPAEDVAEVLAAFPDGVTTAEVAAVMAPSNTAPDLGAAEDELIALAASGGAQRVAVGHDALWASAELAADRLLRGR